MIKSNGNTVRSAYCLGSFVLLTSLLLISLLRGEHMAALATRDLDMEQAIKTQAKAAAMKAAVRAATMGFAPSLEMKENADFLLTPGLLVQEVLSDNRAIIYPSE